MIKTKLKQLFNTHRRNEKGSGEVVSVVMVLPISIIMLFAMIDVSFYMQARSAVQHVAQNGAELVALYGGQSGNIPLNKKDIPVRDIIMPQLYNEDENRCLPSACKEKPIITCTPEIVTESMGLGTEVSCTIKYFFTAPSQHLTSLIGFGGLLESEIEITQSSISETYYMN